LIRDGKVENAEGSWRRLGEGGISFSKEFLKVSGQELDPDGTAFGEAEKTLGIFPSITLKSNQGGPTFRRRLFN
jgi:hypothetical protein